MTLDTIDTTLTLERTFDAPIADVWAAWTDPEALADWFVPAGCDMPECSFDVRVGGRYDCLYVGQESGNHFPMAGRFTEISKPDRIVFTHGWKDADGKVDAETEVVVSLTDLGGRTRLTMVQTGLPTTEARDSHMDGWSKICDKLAARLAA